MSLAVPATLHEVYGQELFELLDTVPASQVVPNRSLRAFAFGSGLALADVYFEEPGVPPHPRGVIPSQEHFFRFGGMYRPMCTAIDIEIGADVPVMSGSGRGGR